MRRDIISLILGVVIVALALCNLLVEVRIQAVERELAESRVEQPVVLPGRSTRAVAAPNS